MSQNNLIFIAGIPGSGKTTLGKAFEKQGYLLLDDPKKSPNFEKDKKYVITDPRLCYRDVFDKVNSSYPKASWIFIKVNPMIAWDRVQKRTGSKKLKIGSFLKFVKELESNFAYYLEQTKDRHKIKETNYGLV